MATLKEYFETDFTYLLNSGGTLGFASEVDQPVTEIRTRVHFDFNSNTKFISCYIPENPEPISVVSAFIENLEKVLAIGEGVEVYQGLENVREENLSSADLNFSGRIFFYSETEISRELFEKAKKEARMLGLYIHLRSQPYRKGKSILEKPLAFISHDTRDKVAVASHIARGLQKLLCPVWYDEFSLNVGDPLRESIEKGIKECRKCILILSPNFLKNGGWTKAEFNSIFTRELIEKQNLVLAVWVGVSKEEVYEYSPTLVDRVGINWELGEEEAVRRLYRAITAPDK